MTADIINHAVLPHLAFGFGMQAKLCVDKSIPVIPVPGPSAVVAALSASGLPTNEFTFGNCLLNPVFIATVNL